MDFSRKSNSCITSSRRVMPQCKEEKKNTSYSQMRASSVNKMYKPNSAILNTPFPAMDCICIKRYELFPRISHGKSKCIH